MPMKKSADGAWKIKLELPRGRYEYKFVMDGMWVQDISNSQMAQNSFGSFNNVIVVE